MLSLNNLDKLHKSKKRVGRGGDLGGTSGKGHKGQKARSGKKIKAFFEGGQMSYSRRLPKRGFNNMFKKDVRIVNLADLEARFEAGSVVNRDSLRGAGLINGASNKFLVKILGGGKLTKNLEVHADSFSGSAKEVIEKAGGKISITQE